MKAPEFDKKPEKKLSHTICLPALSYYLLDGALRLRIMADPSYMRREIEAENLRDCLTVIDEVQKIPNLLDEVHMLIEERSIRFLETAALTNAKMVNYTNIAHDKHLKGLKALKEEEKFSTMFWYAGSPDLK